MAIKTLPPKAKKQAHRLEIHGDVRTDDYYWLNQKDSPEVLNYLNEENQYYKEMTQHTETLQESLVEEMKSRIKLDDESVPYFLNGYWYYIRFEEDGGYPIYCRKKESLQHKEEVLFDVNQMAEPYEYYNLGGVVISRNNKLAAFSVDTVGRRQYSIYIKDLLTGEILPDHIENSSGSLTWSNDNKTIYYVKNDENTLRAYQVYQHILGSHSTEDKLIFHEKDEAFSVGVYKSKSRQFIFINTSSTVSDEYWFLDADQPSEDFKCFQERIRNLEYGVDHFQDHFYMLTNKDDATNFKLMKTSLNQTGQENWEEIIPHRKNVLLEDVDIFRDFLVLSERTTGLNKIRIIRWDQSEDFYIPFESQTYTAELGTNPEFDTSVIRYVFNSMTTPTQVVDFNVDTYEKKLMKKQEILDPSFDENNYYSKRIWAKSEDGVRIPISLVYKKGIRLDGNNPLLLYAYGSYGITVDPSFSSTRLSLLNRGFVFAIAHVRGGEYLGRKWYDTGKMEFKINTFKDFIACSKYLIQQKYTSPKQLYAMGGSAGGMLMGGILNMAPELYNGVIASVPFVDVLTTMLDDSIPLTVGEYDEWGNPQIKKYYDLMKEYSPYDNIEAKAYPNILVTTGYHDSQVQYWEPAKWVAKLRDLKTDDHKLLFHINMDAGHSGASGRFEALREIAEEYAFLLDLEGINT